MLKFLNQHIIFSIEESYNDIDRTHSSNTETESGESFYSGILDMLFNPS